MIPGAAGAATPATPYDAVAITHPEPEPLAQWGGDTVVAGDIDRDRVNDFWVTSGGTDVGSITNAGRVYALSGRTRNVLYKLDSPEPQAGVAFGRFSSLQAIGDLDGDRVSELAVGARSQDVGTGCGDPEPNGCNENQGKVWVFNGKTGNQIHALNNPVPQGTAANSASFGYAVGGAGDVTGDGRGDVIVGAPNNDIAAGCGNVEPVPAGCGVDEGQAFIFNAVTGSLVRTLSFPAGDRQPPVTCTSGCAGFGSTVHSPGDVDHDGVADQLVGTFASVHTGSGGACGTDEPNGCNEFQGTMYLFSGATGALIRRVDTPFPITGTVFGFQSVAQNTPGDLNGDGYAEYFGSASEEGLFEGVGYIFNGATGALLYPLKIPGQEIGDELYALARTDYNKDGTPDLYGGNASSYSVPNDQNGGTYVFDGRNGSLLKSLEIPPAHRQVPKPDGNGGTNYGPFLGVGVAAPGDLNGDGEPDYIAGAPWMDEGATQDQGRVYVFLSRRTPPRPAKPVTPAAAFPGCPTLTANVIQGTTAANRINGTTAADRIFAGTGNDVVDALAGNDCVDLGTGDDRGQGGAGNDLMVSGTGRDRVSGSSGNDNMRGNSDNDRLDGGRGNDRLMGDSGNDTLLGSFGNDRLHGVGGRDVISGSRGRDRINGGASNDRISGGSSGDRIAGDAGNDRIDGNSGADQISGNSGNDRITSRDGSRDRVNCGRGRDSVVADRRDLVSPNCERVRRRR